MSSVLIEEGAVVIKSGAVTLTDDASSCECCGAQCSASCCGSRFDDGLCCFCPDQTIDATFNMSCSGGTACREEWNTEFEDNYTGIACSVLDSDSNRNALWTVSFNDPCSEAHQNWTCDSDNYGLAVEEIKWLFETEEWQVEFFVYDDGGASCDQNCSMIATFPGNCCGTGGSVSGTFQTTGCCSNGTPSISANITVNTEGQCCKDNSGDDCGVGAQGCSGGCS